MKETQDLKTYHTNGSTQPSQKKMIIDLTTIAVMSFASLFITLFIAIGPEWLSPILIIIAMIVNFCTALYALLTSYEVINTTFYDDGDEAEKSRGNETFR